MAHFAPQNRRKFLVTMGVIYAAIQLPLSSCKNLFQKPEAAITDEKKSILLSVLEHLLPSEKDSPGAMDVNALDYFSRILNDPYLSDKEKRFLVKGIIWPEKMALRMYNQRFILLNKEQKEKTLRALEEEKNGNNWLREVMKYLLEAILGDPIYNINTNQAGWKMLNHQTGIPQPTEKTKYPYL
jgi:gluconate 2-dehydrogenase gamma chain